MGETGRALKSLLLDCTTQSRNNQTEVSVISGRIIIVKEFCICPEGIFLYDQSIGHIIRSNDYVPFAPTFWFSLKFTEIKSAPILISAAESRNNDDNM